MSAECKRLRTPQDTGPDCGCTRNLAGWNCVLDIAPSSQPDARTARERVESDWKTAFEMMRRSAGVLNADHPLVVMDDLFDALLAQVERLEQERDEAVERAKALGKVSWDATQRRQEAEARAQRYREALTHYAKGAGYSTIIARRALACDPLVCRDPDLCWGTGTCPRDPACNE